MIGNSQDPQSSQLGLQLEKCLETQDPQSSQLGFLLEACYIKKKLCLMDLQQWVVKI
jgi:hypothetical protein